MRDRKRIYGKKIGVGIVVCLIIVAFVCAVPNILDTFRTLVVTIGDSTKGPLLTTGAREIRANRLLRCGEPGRRAVLRSLKQMWFKPPSSYAVSMVRSWSEAVVGLPYEELVDCFGNPDATNCCGTETQYTYYGRTEASGDERMNLAFRLRYGRTIGIITWRNMMVESGKWSTYVEDPTEPGNWVPLDKEYRPPSPTP